MEDTSEPRQVARRPVTMVARCRTASGMRDEGELTDISTHGCCFTTRSLYLTVGMRVMIKPDGIEAISGIVRWLDGRRAGLQFDTPLYGPVVEHLSTHNAVIDLLPPR